jgi:hypothetical protein
VWMMDGDAEMQRGIGDRRLELSEEFGDLCCCAWAFF